MSLVNFLCLYKKVLDTFSILFRVLKWNDITIFSLILGSIMGELWWQYFSTSSFSLANTFILTIYFRYVWCAHFRIEWWLCNLQMRLMFFEIFLTIFFLWIFSCWHWRFCKQLSFFTLLYIIFKFIINRNFFFL